LVVLSGVPGAGKSTLAKGIVERLDARIIDRDTVRNALFAPSDYSVAEGTIAFSAMLDAARYHLGRERVVVFDGMTFSRRAEVAAAIAIADEIGAYAAVILLDVPTEVAVERCRKEAAAKGHQATNRDAELVQRVAAHMEDPMVEFLKLDANAPKDDMLEEAVAYLERCAAAGPRLKVAHHGFSDGGLPLE
jgi:predicted kinase